MQKLCKINAPQKLLALTLRLNYFKLTPFPNGSIEITGLAAGEGHMMIRKHRKYGIMENEEESTMAHVNRYKHARNPAPGANKDDDPSERRPINIKCITDNNKLVNILARK